MSQITKSIQERIADLPIVPSENENKIMCFHLWNFYQRHSWSRLELVPCGGGCRNGDFRMLLYLPICSPRCRLRSYSSRRPPTRELRVQFNLFGMLEWEMPLECAI